MLRSFVSQLLKKGPARPETRADAAADREAGAVAYVVNIDEPVRVHAGGRLYSDLASVRLRAFVPALRLAASRPVYLVPPALLAEGAALDAVAPIETLVVTKFSTADLLAAPARFEALLAWLAGARDRLRLVADLSDNYAAIGEAAGQPFLGRYQAALGELCTLTVPCEALRAELAPYAKRGIHVIEDPYEGPQARAARGATGDPVRLLWFGQLGTANLEAVARGLARAADGLRGRAAVLRFVTHDSRRELVADIGARLRRAHPSLVTEFVAWSPEATWQAIDECDLVLLPQEHGERWGRVKSHNRLVEAIRGGRLAIASPIPSYLELADYAWVGEDLGAGVEWALANGDAVAARIRAGQDHVAARFSPERIAAEWSRLLAGTGEGIDREAAAPTARKERDPMATDAAGNDVGVAYFKWYYDTGVWKGLHYRGVRTLKSVADMWNYQEIIHERDVQWVVETGTRHGGSALFFADLLAARGARGKVISIDVDAESNWVNEHPRIEFLYGDSAAPDMVGLVEGMMPDPRGRIFVILDSDHSRDHVLRELRAYVPLMRAGDYLVVEDTCVNGHPVRPEFGPGPWEAVEQFLAENPDALVHDAAREAKFGFTCAPRGFFVKA